MDGGIPIGGDGAAEVARGEAGDELGAGWGVVGVADAEELVWLGSLGENAGVPRPRRPQYASSRNTTTSPAISTSTVRVRRCGSSAPPA